MLLRNMSTALGLANGTRLVVQHLRPRLIQARLITGAHKDKLVLIPRMVHNDQALPMPFVCRQFPIRLGFAMTWHLRGWASDCPLPASHTARCLWLIQELETP